MFDTDRLLSLPHNWDGYGSRPPTEREIAAACEIYQELAGTGWKVIPMAPGGVQIEKHAGGLDIEISISESGNH